MWGQHAPEYPENETNPAVRAVLGHFIFVYIHPNMDALEKASVEGNIEPFNIFLSKLVKESLKGTPIAKLKPKKPLILSFFKAYLTITIVGNWFYFIPQENLMFNSFTKSKSFIHLTFIFSQTCGIFIFIVFFERLGNVCGCYKIDSLFILFNTSPKL